VAWLWFICFSWLLAAEARNQPGPSSYVDRQWTVEDGLAHNKVGRIMQDPRGYLWLGTGAGLTRFSGNSFRDFQVPGSQYLSKRLGENIRDLAQAPDGSLIVLPASGGIYQVIHDQLSEHPASEQLSTENLLELHVEPGGALWVGILEAQSKKLARWEAGRVQRFEGLPPFRSFSGRFTFVNDRSGGVWCAGGSLLARFESGQLVPFPAVQGPDMVIAPSRTGGVLVSSGEGLYRMEGGKLTTLGSTGVWREVSGWVRAMLEDSQGVLWIATKRNGLYRVPPGGEPVQTLQTNENITSLLEDTEGNLWVATEGAGLHRLRPRVFMQLNTSTGLADDISLSVCEPAGESGVLLCANRQGGLFRFAGGRSQPVSRGDGSRTYVYSIFPDKGGSVWVADSGGILSVVPGSPGLMTPVLPELRNGRVLFVAADGALWIGTADRHLFRYLGGRLEDLTPSLAFTRHHISAIAQDGAGIVWVSTYDQNLTGFQDTRVVQRYEPTQLPGNGHLHTMLVDSSGRLWLGSSQGLILKEGGKFLLAGEQQGLPDSLIYQILEDDHRRFWIGSRRGIYVVGCEDLEAVLRGERPRVTATRLGRDEGIPDTSASDGAQPNAWHARDGRLWFTTHAGLIGIDPEASLPVRPPPRLQVDQILLDRREVSRKSPLLVGHAVGQIEFRVDAISLSAPAKVRVQHRLEGLEEQWSESVPGQPILYHKLPEGRYRLLLSVFHQDRPGSGREESLEFIVETPWWRTWWFALLVCMVFTVLLAGLVWGLSRRRYRRQMALLERENAIERERARIARNLHDELGGAATQLGLLAERIRRQPLAKEIGDALGVLAFRARRLSGDVESIIWTVNPRNTSWSQLASFISHFTLNLCGDLGIVGEVRGAETIPVLPVSTEVQGHLVAVVKEALNNAAKHSRAARLVLEMKVEAGVFVLELLDDGVGFNPAAPEHEERNGLTNMRTRMQEIGGRFTVASSPGGGACVRIEAPVAREGSA